MPLNKWPIRSPSRTSLYNKHGGRLSFAGKQLELTIAKRERTCTGNFAAISNKLTQKTSVWKTKKLGITRQVQEGAGVEEKQATSSLPRSQPRGPPYEDWFHETPRARPARLLRTRQREREIHRKSVFDGKAGGGGRRGACRERTRGVWVPFFERGLLHRARGSTVT